MKVECNHCGKEVTIDITDLTQGEFVKKRLDIGYINLTIYGYTMSEVKKFIDFGKQHNFNAGKGGE